LLQVVCIKQVADTETRVRVSADGRTLDPAGVTWILNPYDEFALEQALRIREAEGQGEVVVLTLGGPGVQTTLRSALAMGADRGIHLKTDAIQPDSLQVARALADELKGLGARILWFGKQAVDDDAAQVAPMVAELLEHPCVTVVAAIEFPEGPGGARAVVEREVEGGREVVEVSLPAVLAAEKGLNEPRYASLKGIMAAKKKPIEEKPVTLAPAALETVSLALPAARAPGRIVGQGLAAVPELVRVLREEAKVI
jgi:electron transfer flavoprotein beta subunit